MAFVEYSSGTNTADQLVAAILPASSGISVVSGSAAFSGVASFVTASIPELSVSGGILLTSGDASPPTSNTSNGYSVINGLAGDADLDAAVTAAFPFAGDTFDASVLTFNFEVADPATSSVRFDIVFGSEEFPEYSSSTYVDIGAVIVNGVNYALFNGDPTQPLSVIDANLAAGNFVDNAAGALPIEYDGISGLLSIVAPVVAGINTVKIGVADTGDSVLDSGLFITNFQALGGGGGGTGGCGVFVNIDGSDANETIPGTALNELIDAKAGDDVVDAAAGCDLVLAGAGNDIGLGGEGNDTLSGDAGTDLLDGGAGNDRIDGGLDADELRGGLGRDVIRGGAGNDTLDGGAGHDRVIGNQGADRLGGGVGNDTLFGGGGDDTLMGHKGSDVLTGDAGADIFSFGVIAGGAAGDQDEVTDFQQGTDWIGLRSFAFTSFADVQALITDQGGDTLLSLSLVGGEDVLIRNVEATAWVESDFLI